MENQGMFVNIKGEKFYKIENSHTLSPFLINIASSSDIWIFLSSQGGLTAGRKTADNNIFPFETDDSLHVSYDAGSRTYIKLNNELWQPFEQNVKYKISQNIYKAFNGASVIIEEVNHDWNLSYSYHLQSSEKYGIIKTSNLQNLGETDLDVEVLDGMLSIMPFGVDAYVQALSSNLVDSYKAGELVDENLGVFSLTSQINNSPIPVEILKANIAYNTLKDSKVYLNTDVISAFKNGDFTGVEQESYGKNLAYFVHFENTLKATSSNEYSFVMDIDVDIIGITHIKNFIKSGDFTPLYEDIKKCTEVLVDIVKMADGMQNTADEVATAHHYLNTLYNVMRGGTFENVYEFDFMDFAKFVEKRNRAAMRNIVIVKECKTIHQLKEVTKKNDLVLYRLALEYLPLTFSRRHGDPSRPWNDFNITIKDENGEKITNYEGYWRDIFQNWEALGLTYPAYYENMVAKFVNASTFDGFNPYQINNEGIEWEKPDPENPLANFGYWGDHQIVYLLRLLMGLNAHYPTRLQEMLTLEIFSYANVPYILETYNHIKENSKETITFDFERDQKLEKQSLRMGTDGRLLIAHNKVYTVTLAEKLLVPLMSKVSNLLVGSGIWMNTQRPEWNDANNALVGTGLSMITVYHMKAYVDFLLDVFGMSPSNSTYNMSENVLKWFLESFALLNQYVNKYEGYEKEILDGLGHIFSAYRLNSYKSGFDKKSVLDVHSILNYLKTVNSALEYTIKKNNDNGVYATYNLLNYNFTSSPTKHMLEGQAGVIASGTLSIGEIEDLLNNIKPSLYNEKVKAHMLYPANKTKRFMDKNIVVGLKEVINDFTKEDEDGNLRFESDITTIDALIKKIKRTKTDDLTMLKLTDAFEATFAHKKFTGRSQVSYKYEGIGCIYWHQNAKLALAILENAVKLRNDGEDATRLREIYKELMSGFIYRKTPLECHGIPIEPYSHSSYIGKSEQPGMTGQVKELLLIRRLELGVQIIDGQIHFDNWFVDDSEFDENNELSFTIYSVPVVYKKTGAEQPYLNIELASSDVMTVNETFIDKGLSKTIFDRNKAVAKIEFIF